MICRLTKPSELFVVPIAGSLFVLLIATWLERFQYFARSDKLIPRLGVRTGGKLLHGGADTISLL
jgi:hypothetical protein